MKFIVVIVSSLVLAVLAGCASSPVIRVDNIPMYGQPFIERSKQQINADLEFITSATENHASREQASQAWWAQGETFMSEGNLDYAMQRYNQSWLLNPDNYQPYWGFARVMVAKGKVDDAINYLLTAEILIKDPSQKVALFAVMGSVYTLKGKQIPRYFAEANKKFEECVALDPSYPSTWRRWAYSLFEQGNYMDAWEKVLKTQSLDTQPFPTNFISALESRFPRPH